VSVFVLGCTTIVSTDAVEHLPRVSYREVVPDDKKVCQRAEDEAQDPQDEVGQGREKTVLLGGDKNWYNWTGTFPNLHL
jgi:hypothetical protein